MFRLGQAWRGLSGRGTARLGFAWQVRAWAPMAHEGKATNVTGSGHAWHGAAGLGRARRGVASRGKS